MILDSRIMHRMQQQHYNIRFCTPQEFQLLDAQLLVPHYNHLAAAWCHAWQVQRCPPGWQPTALLPQLTPRATRAAHSLRVAAQPTMAGHHSLRLQTLKTSEHRIHGGHHMECGALQPLHSRPVRMAIEWLLLFTLLFCRNQVPSGQETGCR